MANKMTNEDRKDLLDFLNEGVALHLYDEYENEEDFEEKFGPIPTTLKEAADMYTDYSDWDDVKHFCKEWIDEFPDSKNELLEIFGVDEDDIKAA